MTALCFFARGNFLSDPSVNLKIFIKDFMKHFLFLFLFFFAFPLYSNELSEDILSHHYSLTLPQGDQASLYFSTDHTLVFMPDITNKEYTHICWAKYKIDNSRQELIIDNANRCQVLNGTYRFSKKEANLLLQEGNKKFFLQAF